MNLVSLDIETTGTDPDRHYAWEIALVPFDGEPIHFAPFLPQQAIDSADPGALAIGGFYTRFESVPKEPFDVVACRTLAMKVAQMTSGATLMGFNVASFDAVFLRRWLQSRELTPAWSHRYLDLGSFAAGAWGAKQTLSSRAVADRIENANPHTAIGDAQWNWEVYRRIVRREV